MPRFLAAALTLGALLWVAALVAIPVLNQTGATTGFIYGIGSVICHQRPERSFSIAGHQLAVCARCFGLYASGAVAALLAWAGIGRTPRRSRETLLIAAVPTILTVPIEWLGISPLSNAIRAVAALPLGAAAGWTFVRALRSEQRNAEV
jgi:uncharacterized membrane protein